METEEITLEERIDAEQAMKFLNDTTRRVVSLYAQGYTLTEIGKMHQRSCEWSRQKLARGLRYLRNWVRYGIPPARLAWYRKNANHG